MAKCLDCIIEMAYYNEHKESYLCPQCGVVYNAEYIDQLQRPQPLRVQDGEKVIFDLKLPEGSRCTAMTVLNNVCVCAAFSVPVRINDVLTHRNEIYILNPDTGKCTKVE